MANTYKTDVSMVAKMASAYYKLTIRNLIVITSICLGMNSTVIYVVSKRTQAESRNRILLPYEYH